MNSPATDSYGDRYLLLKLFLTSTKRPIFNRFFAIRRKPIFLSRRPTIAAMTEQTDEGNLLITDRVRNGAQPVESNREEVETIARDHFGIQRLRDAQWEVIRSIVDHRMNTIFHAPGLVRASRCSFHH